MILHLLLAGLGMNLLYLGVEEQRRISRLRAKAEAAPVPAAEIRRQLARRQSGQPPHLIPAFTVRLPDGFVVAFTIDEQKGGLERHLIVSALQSDRLPHTAHLVMLLREFGFVGSWSSGLTMWIEKGGGGRGPAINIVEPLVPPEAPPIMLDEPVAVDPDEVPEDVDA